MPAPKKARRVKEAPGLVWVRAQPHHGVQLTDGTIFGDEAAGRFSRPEAEALEQQGYVRIITAEEAGGGPRTSPRRKAKAKPQPRKPLTLNDLDAGLGERA